MLIIGTKYGQLGNRLLLFGNIIANAIEHKYTVVNPHFEEYKNYFEGTSNNYNKEFDLYLKLNNKIFEKLIKSKISSFSLKFPWLYNLINIKICSDNEQDFDMNNEKFINVIKNHTVIANGWLFRDKTNLIKHRNEIRKIFRPIPFHQQKIKENIDKIKGNFDFIIGVHVRKGDYDTYKGGIFNYDLPAYVDILKRLELIFETKGKSIAFLICSNEKIDFSNFGNIAVFKSTNHLVEDMYSLAECDYILGPPSSFTKWASYYGRRPLYAIEDKNEKINLDSFKYTYE